MSLSPEQKQQIFQQLKIMARYTGEAEPDRNQIFSYLDSKDNPESQLSESTHKMIKETNNKTADVIINLMQKDLGGAELLKDTLADLKAQAEQKTKAAADLAAQKTRKVNAAKHNEEIRAAKEKMKELAKARAQAERERFGAKSKKEYEKTEAEAEIGGSGPSYVLKSVANKGFGTEEDRTDFTGYPKLGGGVRSQQIEQINTEKGIKLIGQQYIPANPNGKVVICFTGSGAPGADHLECFANNYLKEGTSVVHFDYRGFGQSVNTDKNGNPAKTRVSEKSMYQDAHEMYKYVTEKLHVDPANIILHGFSMGGPVASKLAADISQRNAKLDSELAKKGETLPESKRLGGIVLHSPMVSTSYAYKVLGSSYGENKALGSIAGFLGKASSGSFDTIEHMEKLKKFDPNIPVHYVGGNDVQSDFLSPYGTRIHENPKIQFANQSFHFGPSGHKDPIDTVDPCLSELASKGRKANVADMFTEVNRESFVNGKIREEASHQISSDKDVQNRLDYQNAKGL